MHFKGTAHRYGRDVDTDVIIPARYLTTSDPAELAKHCLEDLDVSFVERVKPGDIIVADENFGCGSSREHAPIAIKAAGVDVVIAKSFARIFYRNSINTCLLYTSCASATCPASPRPCATIACRSPRSPCCRGRCACSGGAPSSSTCRAARRPRARTGTCLLYTSRCV